MLRIEIETDNDALERNSGAELARILREIANTLDEGGIYRGRNGYALFDANGNTVGTATFTEGD